MFIRAADAVFAKKTPDTSARVESRSWEMAFVRPCTKIGWRGGSLTVIDGKESVKDRVLHLGLYLGKV